MAKKFNTTAVCIPSLHYMVDINGWLKEIKGLVLEKFVETFDYLYGERNEAFLEDEGRRYFMLFLKPNV